jgi:hypothetical protein
MASTGKTSVRRKRQQQRRLPLMLREMGFDRKTLREFAEMFGLVTSDHPSIESVKKAHTATDNR